MGACGCGDGFGDFKFPGPDGTIYAVQVYLGCDNCDSPAGVVLMRVRDETSPTHDAPEVPWSDHGHGYAEFFMAIIDPQVMRSRKKSFLEGYFEDETPTASERSSVDFIIDGFTDSDLVPDVARETWRTHITRWLAEVRKP